MYTNGNPIGNLTDNEAFHAFGQGYVAGLPIPAVMMLDYVCYSVFLFCIKLLWDVKLMQLAVMKKVSFIAGIKSTALKFLLIPLPVCCVVWQVLS